jgi:hypothetical protein
MTPAPEKIQLAVIGDLLGNWDVKQVVVQSLSDAQMAHFRRCGQIDCGRRQHWLHISIAKLPEKVVERLFARNLLTAEMDFLHFGAGQMCMGLPMSPEPNESKATALAVAQAIAELDQGYEVVQIDRSIPSV